MAESSLDDEGGGLFCLDDTHGVLSNPQALSLLNAASWPSADQDSTRRVIWTSTTEKALVPEFVFKGKLLILTNYMSELPQAKAFVNRALNLTIEIKAEEIPNLFRDASKSEKYFPDQKLAGIVAEFVIEQAKNFAPGKISLRDLSRAYDLALHFHSPETWREMFVKTLPKRDGTEVNREELVLELHQSGKKVGEQARQFVHHTGLGERTFFKLRGSLGLNSEGKSQAARESALARSKKAKVAAATLKPARKTPLKVVPATAKRSVKRGVQYVADVD